MSLSTDTHKAGTGLSTGLEDLVAGLHRRDMWTRIGWNHVTRRYRRSLLGPLWSTVSLAIFVAALGSLYAVLFDIPPARYIPHLVIGMLVWNFITGMVIDGCHTLQEAGRYLKEIDLPVSVFAYAQIWRHLILFLYQSGVFVVAVIIFGLDPAWGWLTVMPALVAVILVCAWMGLVVMITATRYRDTVELLGNIFRILFFLTPIIWMPESSGRFIEFLEFNPVYHIIEIVRQPLLGQSVPVESWVVTTILLFAGWPVAIWILGRTRNRIPFWI